MSVAEKDFEEELDAFRVSAETAAQFFYAFQAIHFITARDKTMLKQLDETPMFWNTSLGALREAMFIALGRVFDKSPTTHNVHRLLKIAQDNPDIFKRSAPRWHRQSESNEAGDYVPSVYKPQHRDWRRLRKHISNWRKVYEASYRSIRNQVYAHQQRISPSEKVVFFKQTSYVELERLFAFLDALYEALRELYSGHKPVIRYRRRSLVQMLSSKAIGKRGLTAGELVARDIQKFFEIYASRNRRSGT